MNKIMILTPALYQENTRKYYSKYIPLNKELLEPDEFVIYDQCAEESDYLPGYTYIGYKKEKQGFIKPRNELLKYFYNSDVDYAIWMDANDFLSKTSYNDALTLINFLRENSQVDAIVTTMGIMTDPDRMEFKQMPDYFDNVYLIPKYMSKCEWLHFCVIKNYKKFYNKELYIDERCDVKAGICEDIYFVDLLRKYFNVYKCPTLCTSKPNSGSSTWMNNSGSYDYPTIRRDEIQKLVSESDWDYKKDFANSIILPRVDKYKELLKEYKPRAKTKTIKTKNLFQI